MERRNDVTIQEIIRDRSLPEPNTGCWLWTAGLDNHGYGQLTHRHGHNGKAYRVSYEAFVGSIPKGLTLDHRCRTRCCVNPDHLEPVTLAENKRRGMSFAAIHARKIVCPQGHSLSPESGNVRIYRTSRVCKTCHRLHEAARQQRRRAGFLPLKPGFQKTR